MKNDALGGWLGKAVSVTLVNKGGVYFGRIAEYDPTFIKLNPAHRHYLNWVGKESPSMEQARDLLGRFAAGKSLDEVILGRDQIKSIEDFYQVIEYVKRCGTY